MNKFEYAGKYNPKIKDYKVWQDGYHPVACFSKDFLFQKLDYIHNNPVKAGLVWAPQYYALSSAIDYAERRKGKVDRIPISQPRGIEIAYGSTDREIRQSLRTG